MSEEQQLQLERTTMLQCKNKAKENVVVSLVL